MLQPTGWAMSTHHSQSWPLSQASGRSTCSAARERVSRAAQDSVSTCRTRPVNKTDCQLSAVVHELHGSGSARARPEDAGSRKQGYRIMNDRELCVSAPCFSGCAGTSQLWLSPHPLTQQAMALCQPDCMRWASCRTVFLKCQASEGCGCWPAADLNDVLWTV